MSVLLHCVIQLNNKCIL